MLFCLLFRRNSRDNLHRLNVSRAGENIDVLRLLTVRTSITALTCQGLLLNSSSFYKNFVVEFLVSYRMMLLLCLMNNLSMLGGK